MKLKLILIIPLFVFIQDTFGQCVRIYRCTECNRNVDASSNPNGGNDCYDNSGNRHGHRWKFEGYRDSECQARYEREVREEQRQRDLARENCLRKSIKTYKGGNATEWYCPSGKPYSVNFNNGAIVITYFESGQIESKRYNTGQYEQYDENGQLKLKGKYNSEGRTTGEWYMIESRDGNCTNCTVTFDDNGKFLCKGTLAEYIIENDFNNCNSEFSYNEFRRKYPNSIYDSKIVSKINEYVKVREEKELKLKEDLNEYIEQYNSKHKDALIPTSSDYEIRGTSYAILDVSELKTDTAIFYYRIAIGMDTSKFYLNNDIAKLLTRSKKFKDASEVYEIILAKNPNSLKDHRLLGITYYFANLLYEANATFSLFIDKYPNSVDGYLWQARTKRKMDAKDILWLAKPYFEKYIEVATDPVKYKKDLVEAYQYLGSYYITAKDKAKSTEMWSKVKVLDPANKLAEDALK